MKRDVRTNNSWFAAILLALAPPAGTWLYLRQHWEEIPSRFPTHWGIDGVANRWTTRSAGTVALPLAIGVAIIVLIIFTAVLTTLAQKNNQPPAARVMLPILGVISWSMSVLFCWIALMPLGRSFGPVGLIAMVTGQSILIVGMIVWVSRQAMNGDDTATSSSTPDAAWRAGGIVYYNPADEAVLVPKRLGWGWTLNFGRPVAWLYLGVTVILIFGATVVPLLLK